MAAPELVICSPGQNYKAYPGGVIVLAAVDWMGAARGTLTSEIDTRSCCGEVVRESQQTGISLYDTERVSNMSAFNSLDDTLTIDLAQLPIEPGVAYSMLFSVLIEGDWDRTNSDTVRNGDQEEFPYACNLSVTANSSIIDGNNNYQTMAWVGRQWRALDTYRIVTLTTHTIKVNVTGTETINVRAYSQAGTTIEYLLDQVYFLPSPSQLGGDPDWTSSDFSLVDPFLYEGIMAISDGADGGDAQGKFTWWPSAYREEVYGFQGAGDYQRKSSSASAEYMARIIADGDYIFIWNDITNTEANAHCYGLHGQYYIPEQDWVNEIFDQTLGDGNFAGTDGHFETQPGWGVTDEGFEWYTISQSGPGDTGYHLGRYGTSIWMDGTNGYMEIIPPDHDGHVAAVVDLGAFNSISGARILSPEVIRASGKFTYEYTQIDPPPHHGPPELTVDIGTQGVTGIPFSYAGDMLLRFNLYGPTPTWEFFNNTDPGDGSQYSDTLGFTEIGFRFEVLRYRVRVKVWDATGAEPGTWDYEDYRRIYYSGITKLYPYDDDTFWSTQGRVYSFAIACRTGGFEFGAPAKITWNDIRVWNDPIGSAGETYASIERPEGTEVASIATGSTCQNLVYWGTRDWTEFVPADGPYLEFSHKTWSATDAAELQRATSNFLWFRSVHFSPKYAPIWWEPYKKRLSTKKNAR